VGGKSSLKSRSICELRDDLSLSLVLLSSSRPFVFTSHGAVGEISSDTAVLRSRGISPLTTHGAVGEMSWESREQISPSPSFTEDKVLPCALAVSLRSLPAGTSPPFLLSHGAVGDTSRESPSLSSSSSPLHCTRAGAGAVGDKSSLKSRSICVLRDDLSLSPLVLLSSSRPFVFTSHGAVGDTSRESPSLSTCSSPLHCTRAGAGAVGDNSSSRPFVFTSHGAVGDMY